jgi:L,D-peptidoglycan transpeptidase YkuD (ErfK/YbiS/YcfS/YnhG family)
MKNSGLLIAATLLFAAAAGKCADLPALPDTNVLHAQQVLLVITPDWGSLQGRLYGFEKRAGQWVMQFSNAVVLGSKGLGIGEGMVPMTIADAPVKKEGDLKSPAGIFSIGAAFGYAGTREAGWIKDHYVQATDTLICVDDPQSAHYNTLVQNDSARSDWKSFEQMHRRDDYYKWGLFINHNAEPPAAGKGSCIFMHIWGNDHQGTTGCTAMKEEDMLRILHWINIGLDPVLVQLPEGEYPKLAAQYHLPTLPSR